MRLIFGPQLSGHCPLGYFYLYAAIYLTYFAMFVVVVVVVFFFFVFFVLFWFCLTSRLTMFLSFSDGAITSWVLTSTLGTLKCLAQMTLRRSWGSNPGPLARSPKLYH